MEPWQEALADIFLRSTELMKDARGIASLSGIVPPLVPFVQTFAAVITAAHTGSLYYIATAPKGVMGRLGRFHSHRQKCVNKDATAVVHPCATICLM
ncbi:uncharacterized protein LOC120711868 isoform X2 [Panicum virgatum]|uniref:uncharacterized protein LOC120711868 isoform X2 n=1 Tax=Panicum virgatum TaxID=38727 RepID=UPI0019D5D203|nr:uncharacterized protein LOC120711868 isoform X2 [Panicum virgatum]